jgi:hypothetical protein
VISPADLDGHWRRNWLRAPGFEDATTRVHWLQAGPWCADIRVPLVRPNLSGCASLSAMAPADLAVLITAEGFAGTITLQGDVCTWHRTWNWRGFPCPVDAGTLWFDASGHLIEDGVHADYREDWERVPADTWTAFAVETSGADGMLLSNDKSFLLALGQKGAPAFPTLAQDLREGRARTEDAADVFASVYVLGHWEDGSGIADLSTQPFCEGTAVLTRRADRADLVLPDFHGRSFSQSLRLSALSND